jgi:hypothetical protein
MTQKSSSCAQPWREGAVSSAHTTLRRGNNATKTNEPGLRYCLALVASFTGDGATIVLQTSSAEAFEQVLRLQQHLGSDPSAWEQQIRALLTSGNPPSHPSRALAAQLLFSQQAPTSPALEQLRQTLRRGRCSTPPPVPSLPGAPP